MKEDHIDAGARLICDWLRNDHPSFLYEFLEKDIKKELRDLAAKVQATAPRPGVDAIEATRIDDSLSTVFPSLEGFETRLDAVQSLVAEVIELRRIRLAAEANA